MAATNAESNAFFRAINEASREREAEIAAEIREYKLRALNEAKETAQKKYDEYILSATAGFAGEDGIEAEKRAAKLKEELSRTRAEIADGVFSAVREKLAEFTKTDEYENLLVKSARKMAEICGENRLDIYMRKEDTRFADKIKGVSDSISVHEDSSIGLGGIYGVCEEKSIKLNDTLETRLEAQKPWFRENSGLKI